MCQAAPRGPQVAVSQVPEGRGCRARRVGPQSSCRCEQRGGGAPVRTAPQCCWLSIKPELAEPGFRAFLGPQPSAGPGSADFLGTLGSSCRRLDQVWGSRRPCPSLASSAGGSMAGLGICRWCQAHLGRWDPGICKVRLGVQAREQGLSVARCGHTQALLIGNRASPAWTALHSDGPAPSTSLPKGSAASAVRRASGMLPFLGPSKWKLVSLGLEA